MDKETFQKEALVYLNRFATENSKFVVHDVRDWAYANGLPKPVAEHWWGAVSLRAEANGIIEKTNEIGMSGLDNTGKRCGRRRCVVWRSKIK